MNKTEVAFKKPQPSLNTQNMTAGLLSALMCCTGPIILLIDAANGAGFSRPQLISWLFAVYVAGGMLSVVQSMIYKIPVSGAHSITAAAFLSTAAASFSISELVGSYLLVGAIVVCLGLSGIFEKALRYIPRPLLDAMLAGLVLNYIVKIVPALKAAPLIGGFALLGFFVMPKLSDKIAPIIGVLVFGVIGLLFGGHLAPMKEAVLVLPQFTAPAFSLQAFISISIPVAVLILSNDIAVAFAALRKNGFEPPTRRIMVFSGLGTMLVSFFGGHAATIGGVMSALCSDEEAGPKQKRYWGAVFAGVVCILFGVFAWAIIVLIEVLPLPFITIVAGFTLVGILMSSLQAAFSERAYRYSTLFAFAIAVSGVSFIGIASPVWSLLIGVLTAKVLKEGVYGGKA